MVYSVPNQKTVAVHREKARTDFLGIKNENWQAAARDLGPFALTLYLYFAANADGYELAFSPAAVNSAIGMAPSTARDQFKRLIDKKYLVQRNGNGFDFYETPQASRSLNNDTPAADRSSSDVSRCSVSESPTPKVDTQDREINNMATSTNRINIGSVGSSKSKEFIF